MSSAQPLLSYRGLTVAFTSDRRTTEVVHGIDIDVERGQIVALVGESGSGKTVTALAAVRLLPRTATIGGQVLLDGVDLLALDESAMRSVRGNQIAFIFQDPAGALDPVFTVGYQLIEAIRQHHPELSRSQAADRAAELLSLVGIPDPKVRMRDHPHQFSGGQCQRIMIAMALSCEPDVLIADEPTTALDVTVQQEILDVLVELRDRLTMTVLVITHDMGVVADVADRVVVMRHGRIEEQAPVDRLFAEPEADYTRMLLATVPKVGGQTTIKPASDEGASPPSVLSIRDLHVTYRTRRRTVAAVRGISLDIGEGEIVGLVGESGSGKSTIGKAVLGLAPIGSGEILLGDDDLTSLSGRSGRHTRGLIGAVFQNPAASINPRFTIGTAIGEPLRAHRGLRGADLSRAVRELLDAVRLPTGWADKYPHELSGGQRQRVSIARAVSLRPRLLIADEPTSALDVSVQATVLELFGDLQSEFRFGCLFITHDLAVVDQLCDRVVVLHNGSVVEDGTREQILYSPTHDYTKALIAAAPVADPQVQRDRRQRRQETGARAS